MNTEELTIIEKRLESGVIKPSDVKRLVSEVRSLQEKLSERIADVESIAVEIDRQTEEQTEDAIEPRKKKGRV